jgi:hypothetical protein
MHVPAYEDGTECSKTLAYETQTPGNYPEESIKQNDCCIHGVMTSSCFIFVLLLSREGNAVHTEFFSNVMKQDLIQGHCL